MKITFLFTDLIKIGGAGKFFCDTANKLCEKDHKITVIAQKINHNIYKLNKKISIIEIGGFQQANPLYWLLFFKIRKKYLNALKKIDSELLFSHLFPTNYFCSILNKSSKTKHIYYCQEPFRYFYDKRYYLTNLKIHFKILIWFFGIFFKKYDLYGSKNADAIVCNSYFTKKKAEQIYERYCYVHYPLIDFSKKFDLKKFILLKNMKLNNNSPVFFSLGLSNHMKGTKELILIFKKILDEIPGAVLLIGGKITKSNKKIIKKLTKKLKIPKNKIILYGFINEEMLNSFYSNSTLTLYTAIEEPFGLIPLESMRNGTPVIAFEGGPSETIKDGKTGYLIKNQDLDEFASKAIRLIKDKSLYKKFCENSKVHIKNNFNFENSISNLERFFQKIIQEIKY